MWKMNFQLLGLSTRNSKKQQAISDYEAVWFVHPQVAMTKYWQAMYFGNQMYLAKLHRLLVWKEIDYQHFHASTCMLQHRIMNEPKILWDLKQPQLFSTLYYLCQLCVNSKEINEVHATKRMAATSEATEQIQEKVGRNLRSDMEAKQAGGR